MREVLSEVRRKRDMDREQREWGMIFIEGDKAWCLFPQGIRGSSFCFFKSTLCFQLIVFRSLFSTITLSLPPLSDWVTVCLQESAAASSVLVLHTYCVYSVNTKRLSVCTRVVLLLWGQDVGFSPNPCHFILRPISTVSCCSIFSGNSTEKLFINQHFNIAMSW